MSPETSFGPTGRPAAGATFGANMSPTQHAVHATISQAEAEAWASFFTLAAQSPAFADEVTRLFDADPPLKRHHLALYLRGRACLCQHHATQQRRQRRKAWLKAATGIVVEHLLARPWAALKGMATGGSDQQPLVLPAIVWNDREAVDPLVTPATLPAQPVVPDGPASLKTPSAALVH